MKIEYDPAKRDETLKDRGLDFRDASVVIESDSVTIVDDRFDYGEVREVSFGWLDGQAVAVVWTWRGQVRRIISMRRMHEEGSSVSDWQDPDDAPIITREIAERGEWRRDGKVVRAATGTWTKAGRPPVRDEAKQQVTLRLDADIIARFREGGPGWQTRLNATLRKAVGMN